MGIRFYNLNGFFVKKLAHGVNSELFTGVRLRTGVLWIISFKLQA